jgi:hypothetical protein
MVIVNTPAYDQKVQRVQKFFRDLTQGKSYEINIVCLAEKEKMKQYNG